MRYYTLMSNDGDTRVVVETPRGMAYDLTSVEPDLVDIADLVQAGFLSGVTPDDIAKRLLSDGNADSFDLAEVMDGTRDGSAFYRVDRPFEPPEVWAAGVTYKTSEMERRRESDTPDVYSGVYTAERPEVFFKATPERCVGPFEAVGIRGDSDWNVPEPELAFVLFGGEIVGFTIGNDMSSRSIEGQNPLYLPQAKVFDRCCAIGPCLVTPNELNPSDLEVACSITRAGEEGLVRPDVDLAHGQKLRGAGRLAPASQPGPEYDHRPDRHGHCAPAGVLAQRGRRGHDHDRRHRRPGELCCRGVAGRSGTPDWGSAILWGAV